MKSFRPCQGKLHCRENEMGCQTCGRSAREINEARDMVNTIVEFVAREEYDNPDEFLDYVKKRVLKKLASA